MASTLHFINYNNYFNRIHKGDLYTHVSDYSSLNPKPYSGLNFNPQDGVDTMHYINDPSLASFPYDYVLVSDDNSDDIISKWFVIESKWNRKHQWELRLHRDSLCDFKNKFKDKPFFCRKGYPGSASPLVYNSEGRQYNQILKSRRALRQSDTQLRRYIIGFVDKTWPGGNIITTDYVAEYEDMAQLPINTSKYVEKLPELKFSLVNAADPSPSLYGHGTVAEVTISTDGSGPYYNTYSNAEMNAGLDWPSSTFNDKIHQIAGSFKSQYIDVIKSLQSTIFNMLGETPTSNEEIEWWNKYENKPIKIGDKIYTFSRGNPNQYQSVDAYFSEGIESALMRDLKNVEPNIWCVNEYTLSGTTYRAHSPIQGQIHYTEYNVIKTEVPNVTTTFLTPQSAPNVFDAAPYYIFFMEDWPATRKFAGYIARQFGTTFLYDMQLFPYKPDATSSTSYDITIPGTSYVLKWASSDSKIGTCYMGDTDLKTYNTASAKKVGANQDMCRLMSPNGSSAWDFNPSLIGGVKHDGIKYEFTLMPFNSYLHIFPHFDNLYGDENKGLTINDTVGESRGIVTTGPWSIPYSTSRWSEYQINNSAYMNSFTRQIENMSLTQSIDRQKEYYAGVLGSLSSGLDASRAGVGVLSKFLAGSAGAIATAWAADKDMELNDQLRKEQINYTKDQFYNSLRNIQAQSQPLVHNNSITIGNSWWPIIELYEATDEEKQYLIDDLKIHGWTMGIATTFATAESLVTQGTPTRYIQGDLINVDLGEDAHLSNEIAKELHEGVYIYDV